MSDNAAAGGRPRTIAQLPWVKARVGLERDPVVLFMASRLKRHRKYVVGCWLALWAWSDGVTEDGRLPGLTPTDIDAVVEHRGFAAAAMAFPEHPWIEVRPWGLLLPRYDRHNGVSAKGRALDAERKRRARLDADCPQSVPVVSGSDPDVSGTRGEERRIKDPTLTRPDGGSGPCGYCGATAEQVGRGHQLDHFRPRHAGGADGPENRVLACYRCNQAKAGRIFGTLDEARDWLHRAYWSSNRQRWIAHRRFAFGGKPPADYEAARHDRAGGNAREEAAATRRAWKSVRDAISSTGDATKRAEIVGQRIAGVVALCGGFGALGAMAEADAQRAFKAAMRGTSNGHDGR